MLRHLITAFHMTLCDICDKFRKSCNNVNKNIILHVTGCRNISHVFTKKFYVQNVQNNVFLGLNLNPGQGIFHAKKHTKAYFNQHLFGVLGSQRPVKIYPKLHASKIKIIFF